MNALPYLSFVGVFVLAVGIACLYGAWLARPINPEPRLEVVWLLTAITRGLVAIFVASKIVLGALEPGWTMVAVADGALAMLQMIGLSRGWLADAAGIETFSGWRGVGLIAITYVYFLIFAQFAFLKRLAMLGIADTHLKAVMGAMALGGILLSLLTPRVTYCRAPQVRVRMALAACGLAAILTILPLGLAASTAVAFLIGAGLGLLTVTTVN